MSVESIRYALENRTAILPVEVDEKSLREAGCWDHVCVLPDQFDDRVRYLGDALVQSLTRSPKDDNLRLLVGTLCQSLSYVLNSTSWQDGELHDFDLDEIRRKLSSLK